MALDLHILARGLLAVIVAAFWWRAFRTGAFPAAFIATVAAIAAFVVLKAWRAAQGRRFILAQPFPAFLRAKLRAQYPALSDGQVADVERGLRQFFIASARSGGRFVAMPSKVVDALWHEFILHTRGYERYCRRAFGRLLHHTPAEALPPQADKDSQRFAGLRRAWYWSCKEEAIDPKRPSRLPLLFALDAALAVEGGYRYVPDCSLLGADRGSTHCGTSFGCGSSCGSGGGDGSPGDGSSGGDGGCGGGCGGGGGD